MRGKVKRQQKIHIKKKKRKAFIFSPANQCWFYVTNSKKLSRVIVWKEAFL